MKAKSKNTTYFDVFGDAQTEIQASDHTDQSAVDVYHVRQLVLSIFGIKSPPKMVKIAHCSLVKREFVLFFQGLDQSRLEKFCDPLSNFHSLKENGFPVMILAKAKKGNISNPEQSFLGYAISPKVPKTFTSYDEMVASEHKLQDNGFPLKSDPNREKLSNEPRYKKFGMKDIPDEVIAECSELPEETEGALPVIALDCEMIETIFNGETRDELARLSAVDENGEVVIDEYFKPIGEVSDLRTHVSGITKENLEGATFMSNEGVKVLSKVADKRTFIVGHSLENDFRALRLFSDKAVDTSLIYNNEPHYQYPRKPPLREVYKKYIGSDFRVEGKSHDSVDDARAALKVAQYALSNSVSMVPGEPMMPELWKELQKGVNFIDVFSDHRITPYGDMEPEKVRAHLEDNPEERLKKFIEFVKESDSEFGFAHFNGLGRCETDYESEEKECLFYNKVLGETLAALPKNSMLIIYTGCGNLKRVGRASDKATRDREIFLCRQGLLWAHATTTDMELEENAEQ